MKMKLLLLIIIFLCFNSLLTAQVNWNKILIENDLRNIQSKEFSHDSINTNHQNLLIEKIPEILSESGFLLDSILSEDYIDSTYCFDSKKWFEYDLDGYVIKKYTIPSKTPTAPLWRDEYFYDINHQIVEWASDVKKNGEWINGTRRFIAYYEQGKAKDTIKHVWIEKDKIWLIYDKCELEYDNENIISRTYLDYIDGKCVNNYKKNYTYSNRLLSDEIHQLWNNAFWVNHKMTVYCYDENDKNSIKDF